MQATDTRQLPAQSQDSRLQQSAGSSTALVKCDKDNPPQQFLTELGYNKQQWQVLTQQFFPSARTLESCLLVATMCKAKGLDLMSKPFHIVPMNVWKGKDQDGRNIYEKTDQIWPSVTYYEIIAHRTGEFAGIDPVEFGPDKEFVYGEGKGAVKLRAPEWAIATVYRLVKGEKQAFSERLYFAEYVGLKDGRPNDMWAKKPRSQMAKCCKSAALRIAFPEVGSEPTAEEMEAQYVDADATTQATVITDEPATKAIMSRAGGSGNVRPSVRPQPSTTSKDETATTVDAELVDEGQTTAAGQPSPAAGSRTETQVSQESTTSAERREIPPSDDPNRIVTVEERIKLEQFGLKHGWTLDNIKYKLQKPPGKWTVGMVADLEAFIEANPKVKE